MRKDDTMRKRPNLVLRLIVMLLLVGILFGGVFGWGFVRGIFIAKFLAGFGNQVQTVATMTAPVSTWQAQVSSVGSLTAVNGASLSAEVSGIVDSLHFESGAQVKAGDVLLTLRTNNDPATLAQLQAQAALDQITYDRDRKQFAADAVARSQVDTDRANLAAAQAQVQAQQALMDEKIVRAPFSGTLGIRQVNLGQYLPAGTAIVSLQQLNPLFVDFYLPQQALSQLSVGQDVKVSVDAYPGRAFPAKISALDSSVDGSARSIEVRATLSNDDFLFRPGMFATVDIATGSPQNLVTLPQTAITYNSYGDTVYLVNHVTDANGKSGLSATQVFVQTGDTRGDQIAIVSGVKPGDQVVVAGQVKLHNGSLVAINNNILPADSPNPSPPNE